MCALQGTANHVKYSLHFCGVISDSRAKNNRSSYFPNTYFPWQKLLSVTAFKFHLSRYDISGFMEPELVVEIMWETVWVSRGSDSSHACHTKFEVRSWLYEMVVIEWSLPWRDLLYQKNESLVKKAYQGGTSTAPYINHFSRSPYDCLNIVLSLILGLPNLTCKNPDSY